jgi:predicted PurR-regulated permease PerM
MSLPKSNSAPRDDLARTTLAVGFIALLVAGSLWVLAPFVAALIWAITIVIATWPVLLRLERLFGGRRAPAVAVMTLAMVGLLIVPLFAGVNALLGFTHEASTLASRLQEVTVPAAPAWLSGLPVVGERVAAAWAPYAGRDVASFAATLEPHVREIAAWFAQQAGGLVLLIVQFLLISVLSAVLYAGGESWARWTRAFGRRLAGDRGDRIVVLAGQAIRGVAMGVVITAVLQTALSGVGLMVAGVPFASILTAVIFVFCIAQLGPLLVMLAATAWAFHALGTGWGTALLVWSVVVGTMDNFVRPVLIRRGADLPLLLIFAGVIGGLVAFGIVGIFVGPVVLAVTYTLLDEWVHEPDAHLADDPYGPAASDGLDSDTSVKRPEPAV